MESHNYVCQICNKSFLYKNGLSKHLSYTHKIDLKDYYDKYMKKNKEGICPVCGKNTSFRSFKNGYTKLCKNCLNKSKFPSTVEYWIYHGYSREESIKKVSLFQQEQSKKVKNRVSNTTIEYWVHKGFSEEEAREKIKERQAVGRLDKFIERYGEIEGKKRWEQRQLKWQKTLNNKSIEERERINKLKGITLENMIRKWGIIDGTEKYNDWKTAVRGHFQKSISDISQELFFKILDFIEDKENVKFGKHNKEFYVFANNRIYYYDFTYKNKIIEFNGDIFHANPKIYNDDDYPNPYNKKLLAKTIWELDDIKINVAKNLGYDVLIIWERDYKKNKKNELLKCLQFLNI